MVDEGITHKGRVDYRSLQSAYWKQQAPSTREVAANLRSNLHFNAHLETALAYSAFSKYLLVLSRARLAYDANAIP
jgi:hypothetical protein